MFSCMASYLILIIDKHSFVNNNFYEVLAAALRLRCENIVRIFFPFWSVCCPQENQIIIKTFFFKPIYVFQ